MSAPRKTAVLTGATGGIGRAVAKAYAERGLRLVLVGRDAAKLDALLASLPGEGHAAVVADLSLMAETRRAADEIAARAPSIDVLLNVAGAIVGERRETSEGLELTMATNLAGPVVLTEALLPALRAAPAPRVVMTGSEAIAFVRDLTPTDLNSTQGYRGFPGAYARAKAWLTVWAATARLDKITVTIVDPGGTKTEMSKLSAIPWPIRALRPFIMHGPDVAARAFLRAGLDLPEAAVVGRIVTPKKVIVPKPKFREDATGTAIRKALRDVVEG